MKITEQYVVEWKVFAKNPRTGRTRMTTTFFTLSGTPYEKLVVIAKELLRGALWEGYVFSYVERKVTQPLYDVEE